MIGKQDILARAREWKLRPETVEKDYVLGWLLAAVAADAETSELWVLKGGTCVKKCFIETYRFSEDLDFSLYPDASYTADSIAETLRRLAAAASEMSGVELPSDQVVVKVRKDKLDRLTFEGGIGYRGPLEFPSWPRIRFDITQHEPIADEPIFRNVIHPYPDGLPPDCSVQTYSFEELLAEKTRALFERARPRDLYDVVYVANNTHDFSFDRLRTLWRVKCATKGFAPPSRHDLVQRVTQSDEIRGDWEDMLAHQLAELVPIDAALGRLDEALSWMDERAPVEPLPPAVRVTGQERAIATSGVRLWNEAVPLESLRFAGANRLMVDFGYDGKPRRVEPYSLRIAGTGNLLLYAYEIASDKVKAFKIAEMQQLKVTNASFTPRYAIELGIVTVAPPSARRTPSRRRRAARTRVGPTYEFECPVCGKHFRRRKNDPTLRKHMMPGNYGTCSGRRGYLVSVQ